MRRPLLPLIVTLVACSDLDPDITSGLDTGPDASGPLCEQVPWSLAATLPYAAPDVAPDPRALSGVLYELQVRSANACDPTLGSDEQRAACLRKPAPTVPYAALGRTCADLDRLERIRLGTLDDLLESTTDPRDGITLDYIAERVGADLLWLMPPFPNNNIVDIPDGCDNLGSPYSVRDYFHISGHASGDCIARGLHEYSTEPCWGNDTFDALLERAAANGQSVLLDVAFNHFGHQYLSYDVVGIKPLALDDPAALWDFEATLDPALIWPEVLDQPQQLNGLVGADAALLAELDARCPRLGEHERVRAFAAWRLAFPEERAAFACDDERLEARVPSFYLDATASRPSANAADDYTRDWYDVRFLFHRRDDPRYARHALRNREYLFRVLNYWSSRGVAGYRLDHATDEQSGIDAETWRYVLAKLDFYAALRGQEPALVLGEEFFRPQTLVGVADMLTEGYLFDMAGRNGVNKTPAYVEQVLAKTERFGFGATVMAALENHDELRLVEGTGFTPETGASFWALGVSSFATPMLLVGQELGQPTRLEFKRSHLLSARFEGGAVHRGPDTSLTDFYRTIIAFRSGDQGAALRGLGRRMLRRPDGEPLEQIVAMLRWDDQGQVLLAAHNLWLNSAAATVAIPVDLAAGVLGGDPCARLRLVDRLSGREVASCRDAAAFTAGFPILMSAETAVVWASFEPC